MTNPDIHRLIDQVNNDTALQARFAAISDEASCDALLRELGYDLTYADLTTVEPNDSELSESELTEVAGGRNPYDRSSLLPPEFRGPQTRSNPTVPNQRP